MPAFVKKHPALSLVLTCYAVGLLVFLVWCGVGLAQNRLAYQSGALQTAALTLGDFDFVDLEPQEDGTLLSVGGDPQLRLRDAARRVENVTVDITYRLDPILVNVFWGDAAAGEAAYSPRRMAYGSQTEGGLRFLLPAAGGQSLRIDPGTTVGNTITVGRITINEKRPFYAFFIPSGTQSLMLCVLPALAACGLGLLCSRGWNPPEGGYPRPHPANSAHRAERSRRCGLWLLAGALPRPRPKAGDGHG